MRVLHVVNYGWPYVDGYTARTRSVVAAQRGELGLDAVVAVSPFPPFARAVDPGLVADGWGPAQAQVSLDWETGGALRAAARRLERPALRLAAQTEGAFRRGLAHVVAHLAPDVVHAHHPAYVGRSAGAVARHHGLPFVYEVRCFNGDYDLDARNPYVRARGQRQNLLELALCRAADHVVTISSGLAARVRAAGVPAQRLSVVRNAVDTELWRPTRRAGQPGVLRVGYATTFEAIEGLGDLVAAAGLARDALAARGRRLEVVIAGAGRDWARIRALVDTAGLGEVVRLPGFLARPQLQRLYAELDLFVVPRRPAAVAADTTPLKPLEAVAAGLPLLTTDLPALRELLADRDGVRHVAPTPAALAAGLLDFADEPWTPTLPPDLGDRSWAAEVHRYLPVYQAVGAGV